MLHKVWMISRAVCCPPEDPGNVPVPPEAGQVTQMMRGLFPEASLRVLRAMVHPLFYWTNIGDKASTLGRCQSPVRIHCRGNRRRACSEKRNVPEQTHILRVCSSFEGINRRWQKRSESEPERQWQDAAHAGLRPHQSCGCSVRFQDRNQT